MATWEICYQADGVRYKELVDDPNYGAQLSSGQITELVVGLQGESDEHIEIVWLRSMEAPSAQQLWPMRNCLH